MVRRTSLVAAVAAALLLVPLRASERTALDEYVAKPDSHFSWKLVSSQKTEGGTYYVLEMISQQWLTEKEVNKPIWRHWVSVIKPDVVDSKTGLLFISGGG